MFCDIPTLLSSGETCEAGSAVILGFGVFSQDSRLSMVAKPLKYFSSHTLEGERHALKKTILGIMLLTVVSVSMLTMAFNIQLVKAASGTIYIMPDGSISPSTANITTADYVTYTFTRNNYLPIVVNRSNVIINGRGHTLQSSLGNGFSLSRVCNVTIKNVIITDSWDGISLDSSDKNTLSDNNITANDGYGIYLYHFSNNNTLSRNNVKANNYEGIWLDVYCDNNILSGNSVTANTDDGISLRFSSGNTLSGNNVANNWMNGIHLWASSNSNTLSGNKVTANGFGDGIDLISSCDNNVLSGNDVTANSNIGIYLTSSSTNVLTDNNITANSGDGIDLAPSYGNVLTDNNITANSGDGIYLWASSGNVFSDNNVKANSHNGIALDYSSGNKIFHNCFSDNAQQTWLWLNSTNTWDDSYPSGGNYWSDYLARYPNAAENDSSAIWNTPYVIDANNTDRYPLMAPFKSFNIAWDNHTYSFDTISNSLISNLSFNPNATPYPTLSFNVTGTNDTIGFCRVAIPKEMMWCGNDSSWRVIVDGTLYSNQTMTPSSPRGNYTYIYFTYHHNTEIVQITSTYAVPEFQPFMLLPLLMVITLLGATVSKKKRNAMD